MIPMARFGPCPSRLLMCCNPTYFESSMDAKFRLKGWSRPTRSYRFSRVSGKTVYQSCRSKKFGRKHLTMIFGVYQGNPHAHLTMSYGNAKVQLCCPRINFHVTRAHKRDIDRMVDEAMAQIEQWV